MALAQLLEFHADYFDWVSCGISAPAQKCCSLFATEVLNTLLLLLRLVYQLDRYYCGNCGEAQIVVSYSIF